ncbi:mRNA (guanine-N(7))-methyltransferase [Entamoeba marina]
MDNHEIVEERYDSKKEYNVKERYRHELIPLKSFNNWVKAFMLGEYLKEGVTVLDFCGGKGGDYKKFEIQRVKRVVTADISGDSLEQALERHKNDKHYFKLDTIKCNCFGSEFLEKLDPKIIFDVVSCQFAIHYSFGTEEDANQAVKNIAHNLRKGGYFIGTTVNAYRVVKKLKTVPGNSFGNKVFSITFSEEFDKTNIPIFGSKYIFHLANSIDDIPEYLIPFSVFQNICSENGLELVSFHDFHQFYKESKKSRKNDGLFRRMNKGSMTDEQWEAIGFYCAFVFKKVR